MAAGDCEDCRERWKFISVYERRLIFCPYGLLTSIIGVVIDTFGDLGSSAPQPPGWDIWGRLRFAHFYTPTICCGVYILFPELLFENEEVNPLIRGSVG